MHKNAIKIVWGVKKCALFTKNMALFGEKIVRLFVRFLAKKCAPLSSELLASLKNEEAHNTNTIKELFKVSLVWLAGA